LKIWYNFEKWVKNEWQRSNFNKIEKKTVKKLSKKLAKSWQKVGEKLAKSWQKREREEQEEGDLQFLDQVRPCRATNYQVAFCHRSRYRRHQFL
jgi:hypothetical protein